MPLCPRLMGYSHKRIKSRWDREEHHVPETLAYDNQLCLSSPPHLLRPEGKLTAASQVNRGQDWILALSEADMLGPLLYWQSSPTQQGPITCLGLAPFFSHLADHLTSSYPTQPPSPHLIPSTSSQITFNSLNITSSPPAPVSAHPPPVQAPLHTPFPGKAFHHNVCHAFTNSDS